MNRTLINLSTLFQMQKTFCNRKNALDFRAAVTYYGRQKRHKIRMTNHFIALFHSLVKQCLRLLITGKIFYTTRTLLELGYACLTSRMLSLFSVLPSFPPLTSPKIKAITGAKNVNPFRQAYYLDVIFQQGAGSGF